MEEHLKPMKNSRNAIVRTDGVPPLAVNEIIVGAVRGLYWQRCATGMTSENSL